MRRLIEELGVTEDQKYFHEKQGFQLTGEMDNVIKGHKDYPVMMSKELIQAEQTRNNLLQEVDTSGLSSGPGGPGGVWSVPDTGSRLASGVGGFTYDFTQNVVYKPGYDPNQAKMLTQTNAIPSNFIRSLTIIIDDHANASLQPGGSKWLIDSCFVYTMPLRNVQTLSIVPPTVFVSQLLMTNSDKTINPLPMSYSQERELPENTVTKVSAGGVADSWSAMSGWLSSDGGNRGPSNTKTFIHLMSYPNKNFNLKNTGSNDVEIYLAGWNLGGQSFDVPDPSTGTPGSLTLTAGSVANLQVNNYYHFMKLYARMPQADATSTATTLIGAYRGNTVY